MIESILLCIGWGILLIVVLWKLVLLHYYSPLSYAAAGNYSPTSARSKNLPKSSSSSSYFHYSPSSSPNNSPSCSPSTSSSSFRTLSEKSAPKGSTSFLKKIKSSASKASRLRASFENKTILQYLFRLICLACILSLAHHTCDASGSCESHILHYSLYWIVTLLDFNVFFIVIYYVIANVEEFARVRLVDDVISSKKFLTCCSIISCLAVVMTLLVIAYEDEHSSIVAVFVGITFLVFAALSFLVSAILLYVACLTRDMVPFRPSDNTAPGSLAIRNVILTTTFCKIAWGVLSASQGVWLIITNDFLFHEPMPDRNGQPVVWGVVTVYRLLELIPLYIEIYLLFKYKPCPCLIDLYSVRRYYFFRRKSSYNAPLLADISDWGGSVDNCDLIFPHSLGEEEVQLTAPPTQKSRVNLWDRASFAVEAMGQDLQVKDRPN